MKVKSTKKLLLVVSVLAMLFVVSCKKQDVVKTSYKVLSTASTIYDASMKSVADLYKNHQISDKQKDKIIEAAKIYKSSFLIANNAVIHYMLDKTPENQQQLEKCLQDMSKALSNLLVEINNVSQHKSKVVAK